MGAEQLQGAFGKGALLDPDAQRYLPANVEVGSRLGFFIGHLIVGLKQKRRRQKARRYTRSSVVSTIKGRKVLIPEQPTPHRGQEAVEGVPAHVVQIQMVGLEHAVLG